MLSSWWIPIIRLLVGSPENENSIKMQTFSTLRIGSIQLKYCANQNLSRKQSRSLSLCQEREETLRIIDVCNRGRNEWKNQESKSIRLDTTYIRFGSTRSIFLKSQIDSIGFCTYQIRQNCIWLNGICLRGRIDALCSYLLPKGIV